MFQPQRGTAERLGQEILFSLHGPTNRSNLFLPKLEEEKENNGRAREAFLGDVGTFVGTVELAPREAVTLLIAYAVEIAAVRDIVTLGMGP